LKIVVIDSGDLVSALTDTLQDYRSEGYFGELWKEVEQIAEHCKISVQCVKDSLNKLQISQLIADEHYRTETQ
jgi:hypothetical protein